jgi:hypothetical protein
MVFIKYPLNVIDIIATASFYFDALLARMDEDAPKDLVG